MKLTFDYTEQARPLTLTQVKNDCDNYYVRLMLTPDKIIMWEHQLDWIIKDIGKRNLGEIAPHLRAGIRVWGIPLEVRKP